MGDWTQRRAVVTGAAGALGVAVAGRLAEAGAQVGALYHKERGALPPALPGVPAALDDEHAVAAALAELREVLGGPIEILVHCAGGYGSAPAAETDLALWRRMLDANLTSAFLCVRAVLPGMMRGGWGRIVTVGSRAALRGESDAGAYAASKGGLLRLTEAVAAEGLGHGVTCNCVLPGTIDTPSNRRAMPGADTSAWVDPAAIAEVCLFLCSDAAAIISGAAVPVYGRS